MWPFKKKQPVKELKHFFTNLNYSHVANWSEWQVEKAISDGFKSNVPVYSCIKKRYDAVSSIPLYVETFTGGEWVRDDNHPLKMLLDKPNPMMSNGELMRLLISHLDLAGNAFWKKIKAGAGNVTQELWPVAPYPCRVEIAKSGLVSFYEFGSRDNRYDPEDICHFKYTNPKNPYYGQSPLQAAAKSVDVDNSAQSWQKISMQNRGVPDLHIAFDMELDAEQMEQATDVIKEKLGVDSARDPLVTSKAQVNQLSLTPVEMDFMETRNFNREEVCSVYGVPSSLIANMGDVNLANAETARRSFWLDTILPLMDELIDSLNRCLATEYGDLSEIRINYDTSNVAALQTNYKERTENARALWGMGVPFNVINDRLNLGFDDIEGGDIGYIPSGVIPSSFDFESGEMTEEAKAAILKGLENGSVNREE